MEGDMPGAEKLTGREEHGSHVFDRIHVDKISGRQAARAT
jgi:hypothetical protein